MFTYDKHYDIIVVGAGHAGCESALASARMGCQTLLLTIGLDNIAQMSCNPAIGGTAKGHLVREIDALGGEMGKVTDKTGIQFRMLNKSRGPAVWSLRAQCDKKAYQFEMKRVLESQDNLDVKQALVERLVVENGYVCGVETLMGVRFLSKAVILTTGTFLKGLIHIGLEHYPSGRAWEMPSVSLSDCLKELGFEIGRLKTGTPPRLNGRTINFSELQIQPGDDPAEPFSFSTDKILQEQIPCYITYTNEKTHQIIKNGLDRSPLYSGVIKGTGPRYCPSIEDKVVRFPDKIRHQVFLEPEGRNTFEYYANGIPTSLPEDVQLALVRSIKGLENAEMMRPGYAIEYDFVFPTQLKPNLETKLIQNLFFAGQINGTSGYEEAGAQGIIAGINAVLKLRGEKPFILNRAQAYTGVLIDDLVTKGTTEPYRMFTARAEHRLILRQDNADERLMHYSYQFGLISEEQYKKCIKKKEWIKSELVRLEKTFKKPDEINLLCPGEDSVSLAQLIRRPDIHYKDLSLIDDGCKGIPDRFAEALEIQLKYSGYIERQMEQVEKFSKIEKLKIPDDIDYSNVHGLRTESKVKLANIKPLSIGQASRISGVSPSDISVLMIYIEKRRRLMRTIE